MTINITMCQYGCSERLAVTTTPSNITGKVGESITFPFSAMANKSYTFHLLFNKVPIVKWHINKNGIKIISLVHDQYTGRVSIGNDLIRLNKLSLSDSGPYQVKTDIRSGTLEPPKYTDFHLQVFEPVSKPNITAECLGNNVSLSCFSSQGTEVTYSWETLPPCGDDSCVHLGQRIDLPLHSLSPSTYWCMAHNPVSNAISDSIDLKMCSTQQLQAIWVPVLCATATFLLFGALILLLMYKRKRQKQCNGEKFEDNYPYPLEEQGEVGEPIMKKLPPSAVSSIGPVFGSKPCSV